MSIRTCKICKNARNISYFQGLQQVCAPCIAARKNYEILQFCIRSGGKRVKIHLPKAEYWRILLGQDNCCKICKDKSPGKRPTFIPDATIRGPKVYVHSLVCNRCASVLGLLNHDSTLLRGISQYLREISRRKKGIWSPGPSLKSPKKSYFKPRKPYSLEAFLILSKKIHGETYDYSKVKYKGTKNKVEIICKKHGIFRQRPQTHWLGSGCPLCQSSRGENQINTYLERLKVTFQREVRLPGLKNRRFDFVVWRKNKPFCIEFNGLQHYEIVPWTADQGRNAKLHEKVCQSDKEKIEWCRNNGIPLCQVKYDQVSKIPQIIAAFLGEQ
jgi:hypothetical protein